MKTSVKKLTPPLRLSRKQVPIQHSNPSTWPQPATDGWTQAQRQRYTKFTSAIKDYLQGMKVTEIERKYGLRISQVQEQLARTMTLGPDGNILGFCALIPFLHVRTNNRNAPLPTGAAPSASSCKGGLVHLLKREHLYDTFKARAVGHKSAAKQAKESVVSMQEWLADELTKRGYRSDEYPFTTNRPLYSSIGRLMRKMRQANPTAFVQAYGSGTQNANVSVMNGRSHRSSRPRPLAEVEIDEHKLHGIAVVRICVDGVEKKIPADRAVGIAIIDRGSSAILGGAVCLNPEAKAECLVEAIRSAVIPGYTVKLPSGDPAPPFRPCDFDGSLTGLVWSSAFIDNAKIHTSNQYLSAASRIGSQTCYGPLGSWSGRPDIENLFSRVVRGKFDRLQSATRKDHDYPRGASPAEQAIRHDIDFDVVCGVFFGILGRLNTKPNEGLLNQSPLAMLQHHFKGRTRPLLRRLPCVTAVNPEVGVEAIRVPVRQRSKTNLHMYVSYGGNKYSNDILGERATLKGQEIILHAAPNLRSVQAFELNGHPLGTLLADGVWGMVDHNRDIKVAAARGRDKRFAQHGDGPNVIDQVLQKKAQRVLERDARRPKGGVTKGALELQRMMHITNMPVLNMQTKPASTEDIPASMASAAERARRARLVLAQRKGIHKK